MEIKLVDLLEYTKSYFCNWGMLITTGFVFVIISLYVKHYENTKKYYIVIEKESVVRKKRIFWREMNIQFKGNEYKIIQENGVFKLNGKILGNHEIIHDEDVKISFLVKEAVFPYGIFFPLMIMYIISILLYGLLSIIC